MYVYACMSICAGMYFSRVIYLQFSLKLQSHTGAVIGVTTPELVGGCSRPENVTGDLNCFGYLCESSLQRPDSLCWQAAPSFAQ